jgi:hypothetical protein
LIEDYTVKRSWLDMLLRQAEPKQLERLAYAVLDVHQPLSSFCKIRAFCFITVSVYSALLRKLDVWLDVVAWQRDGRYDDDL